MLEQIMELLEEKKYQQLKILLNSLEPVDIAALMDEVPPEKLLLLFRILSKENAADTFVEMDSVSQEVLIRAFNDRELEAVLDELFLDDTIDIIEEMPANVVKRILMHSDPETRKKINELLNYPKDSAGSIMTIEYVDLKKNMTVGEAIERIRRTGVDKETIYTCYVTEKNRQLIGLVSVKTLLLSPNDAVIEDIMETNIIFSHTHDDKEDVANKINKYGFLAIPVVDNEGRLVGIVTVDDAIDVIQDETTEDIEKMAAIVPSDKPYLKTSTVDLFKKRIPWLLLLMISATFTGKIITGFENALQACVALTAFIPMLMDTGGNAGGQSSVTVIRGLSINEIEMKDILKILWKEIRVAMLCGLTLAGANFCKMMLVDKASIAQSGSNVMLVCAVVSLTLFVAVMIAKLVGCSLPIAAKRIGFDPAVMASPFITTIVDACALLAYFNIAKLILKI